jgi:hypothetical protein
MEVGVRELRNNLSRYLDRVPCTTWSACKRASSIIRAAWAVLVR